MLRIDNSPGAQMQHGINETRNDGFGSDANELLLFARLVGVADARDSSFMGTLDVGGRVAKHDAGSGVCVQYLYSLLDEVGAGLEMVGVVTGAADYVGDEVVALQVGVDGAG